MIQIAVEQHGSKENLISIIEDNIDIENRAFIQKNLDALKRSPFFFPASFINTHATIGAADSFLPSVLLINPTEKMIQSRNNISSTIVKTLGYYQEKGFHFVSDELGIRDSTSDFEQFARGMIFENSNTYPGVFSLAEINDSLPKDQKILDIRQKLTKEQIDLIVTKCIARLKSLESKPYEIMAIHAQFGYYLLKRVVLIHSEPPAPANNPVYGKIVGEIKDKLKIEFTPDQFITALENPHPGCDWYRSFISDDMMYSSPLYTVERSRGRGKPDSRTLTNTLGVMRTNEPGMREKMPTLDNSPGWVDWSKCAFEPNSKIVHSMTSHETPFISSFSGTTSILLNLALSANPNAPEEYLSYLCSVMAYISGAGYHSIHEILAPTAHCLGLIPSDVYPVKVATSFDSHTAPQYNSFYQQVAKGDPDFSSRREAAWSQLNNWYQTTYTNHHQPPNQKQLVEYALSQYIQQKDNPVMIDFLKELSHESVFTENIVNLIESKKVVLNRQQGLAVATGLSQLPVAPRQDLLLAIKNLNPMQAQVISSTVTSLVAKKVNYSHASIGSNTSRFHAFQAKAENVSDNHYNYKKLYGDTLKTAILEEFKASLQDVTREKAIELIAKFKDSPEYKILQKSQGLITRLLNLKTDSIVAFEKICNQAQEGEFEPPLPQIKLS